MFSKFRASLSEPSSDEDASLTTVLPTPALRVEFTLLILLHADGMQKDLSATFDVAQLSSSPRRRPPAPPSADLPDLGKDDAPPSYNAATSNRGRSDYDRRTEQLEDPGLRQVEGAARSFLQNWRVKVLKRVGETLNVRSEDVTRAKHQRAAEVDLLDEQHAQDHQHKAIPTTLLKLDEAKRTLLLNALLMLLLSLESYPAHSRVLLVRVAASLNIPVSTLVEQENTIAKGLLSAAQQVSANDEAKRQANAGAAGRAWKVGLATVAGAAVIGLTGGLAAPLLTAGVGTVMGGLGLGSTAVAGLLGALASNVVLVGGLFGAYGGKMTGEVMDRYAKEVSDFKFLPMREVAQDQHRLRVAIGISGWLRDESDVTSPWRVLGTDLETFALQWELEALLRLGTSLMTLIKNYALEYAGMAILQQTVLGAVAAGLWPLGLLRVARVMDSPFAVARVRADKAGKVLADVLINKAQGERPVTLVGYSLGARVIYVCLQALAERRAFGLVETAVFIGAPAPSDAPDWRRVRAAVAGRVVNVFSANDFVLGILYRTSSIQLGVAGLEEVRDVAGVENFNASELVSGHQRYQYLVGAILKELGLEDLDADALRDEAAALDRRDAAEDEVKKKKSSEAPKRSSDDGEARLVRVTDVEDEDAQELTSGSIEAKVKKIQLAEKSGRGVADQETGLDGQKAAAENIKSSVATPSSPLGVKSGNVAVVSERPAADENPSRGQDKLKGPIASDPELEESSESDPEGEMLHVAPEAVADED